MTRLMYDADRPGDIPRDAQMVAGYMDGSWSKWDPSWWGWFPDSKHVTISAVGEVWDVHLYDIEPGAIWPPENVLPLIVTARANSRWPSVYCNQMNHWSYIRNMFRMRGMVEPPYLVANYDGIAEIPDGAIGKQFKHPPQIGKHYDLSIVRDEWPGVDYLPGEEIMTPDQLIALLKTTNVPQYAWDEDKGEAYVARTVTMWDVVTWLGNEFTTTRALITGLGELPSKDEILEGLKDRLRLELRASGNINVSPVPQSQ